MSSLMLSKVVKSDVQFRNVVFGRQRTVSFSLAGEDWEFQFEAEVPAFVSPISMTLFVGAELVQVELSDIDAIGAIRHMLDGVALTQVPSELQVVFLEAAFEPLLDVLQKCLGQRIRLDRVGTTAASANGKELVSFMLTSSGHRILGRVIMTRAIRNQLQKLIEAVPTTSGAPRIQVPFCCDLEWGRATLKLNELRSLQIHDVLLADEQAGSAIDLVRIVCPHQVAYPAKLNGTQLTISGPAEPSLLPHRRMTSGSPIKVDDVTVVATFSRGHIELEAEALAALHPDQILHVENQRDRPLKILVDGRVVGSGEAVEIGTRVGVRVLNLFGSP